MLSAYFTSSSTMLNCWCIVRPFFLLFFIYFSFSLSILQYPSLSYSRWQRNGQKDRTILLTSIDENRLGTFAYMITGKSFVPFCCSKTLTLVNWAEGEKITFFSMTFQKLLDLVLTFWAIKWQSVLMLVLFCSSPNQKLWPLPYHI